MGFPIELPTRLGGWSGDGVQNLLVLNKQAMRLTPNAVGVVSASPPVSQGTRAGPAHSGPLNLLLLVIKVCTWSGCVSAVCTPRNDPSGFLVMAGRVT